MTLTSKMPNINNSLDPRTILSFRLGRRALDEDLQEFQSVDLTPLPVESLGPANLLQLPGVQQSHLHNFSSGRDYFAPNEFTGILPLNEKYIRVLIDFPALRVTDRQNKLTRSLSVVPDLYIIEGPLENDSLANTGYRSILQSDRGRGLVIVGPSFEFSEGVSGTRPDRLKQVTIGQNVVPCFRDGNGQLRFFLPRRIDVWFDQAISQDDCIAILTQAGLRYLPFKETEHEFGLWRTHVLDQSVNSLRAMSKAFMALEDFQEVLIAEPDEFSENDFPPATTTSIDTVIDENDVAAQDFLLASQAWHANAIKLKEGHAKSKGSPKVKICLVDSGVDTNHPNIADALIDNWENLDLNFDVDEDPSIKSPEAGNVTHGTAVASLMVGQGIVGPLGVAPSCKLVPLKISGSPGSTGYGLRAVAIHQALDIIESSSGGGVINLSWKTAGEHIGIREALRRARDMNVPVVVAAGNYGYWQTPYPNEVLYPAAHAHQEPRLENIVSVGAVNASLERASYSYFGADSITVAAPGGEAGGVGNSVWVSTLNGNQDYLYGTSFAAPQVAGLIALLLSVKPDISINAAIGYLTNNSVPFPVDSAYPLGKGLVDVAATLRVALEGQIDRPSTEPVLVNINTASVEDLAALRPLILWQAQGIVEYRDTHGEYVTPWHLVLTGRIDFTTIRQLLSLVTV